MTTSPRVRVTSEEGQIAAELEEHLREIEEFANGSATPGQARDAALQDAVLVEGALLEAQAIAEGPLASLDLARLLRDPPQPQRFLVEGLLGEGEITNLTSIWGLGKTWLAQDLALAVADPTREGFLGRQLHHGRVFYFDSESSVDLVAERLRWLGLNKDSMANLHYFINDFRLDNEKDVQSLVDIIAKERPALIVFDSLSRFHSLDENSAGDMARLYSKALRPLSRTHNTTLLLLDHPAKDSMGRSRDAAQAARGSGDKIAQVDRSWLFERTGEDATFVFKHGKCRRGILPPPFVVKRHHGHTEVSHSVVGDAADISTGMWANVDDLLAYIAKHGGQVDRSQVDADLYAGKKGSAQRAISVAAKRGLIRQIDHPTDKRKKVCVLTNEEPATGREIVQSPIGTERTERVS